MLVEQQGQFARVAASLNHLHEHYTEPLNVETLARCAVDLSNRPMMVYQVEITNYMVKDFNIALVREFFQGLANALACNLHLKLEYGEEPHHIAEALFKVFARSMRAAVEIDPRQGGRVPSTKGTLA